MKKRMLWIGMAAIVMVLLIVSTVLYLTRNPNVALCLPDGEEAVFLQQKLEENKLQVRSGPQTELEALAEGCAVVLAEPVDLLHSGALEQAAGRTPVVYLNRKPSREDACYIGGDPFQAGYVQGQLLLEQPYCGDWNEDGTVTCVLLGAALNQPDMQQWQAGIAKALEEQGLQLQLLPCEGSALTAQSANNLCTQLLSEHGKDLETVFTCFDAATLGAVEAVEASGRTAGRNLTLIGAGHSSTVAETVSEGVLCGYAYLDEDSFFMAVLAAVEAARIGRAPETVILEYEGRLP